MSERTATRIGRAAPLAVGAGVWCWAAWLLWRTSVPSLQLSGFDEHRYFSAHALARSRRYSRGEEVLWVLATAATLVARLVLVWRLPRSIREIGLGRVGRPLPALVADRVAGDRRDCGALRVRVGLARRGVGPSTQERAAALGRG